MNVIDRERVSWKLKSIAICASVHDTHSRLSYKFSFAQPQYKIRGK